MQTFEKFYYTELAKLLTKQIKKAKNSYVYMFLRKKNKCGAIMHNNLNCIKILSIVICICVGIRVCVAWSWCWRCGSWWWAWRSSIIVVVIVIVVVVDHSCYPIGNAGHWCNHKGW